VICLSAKRLSARQGNLLMYIAALPDFVTNFDRVHFIGLFELVIAV
jgi:hypothetical protein